MSDQVTNPLHSMLSDLYKELQGDAATMSGPLSKAAGIMAGGTGGCWEGPAATSWAAELTYHSGGCATQVTRMLDAVQAELRTVPAQVSTQEAQNIAKLLAMGAYG